MRAKRPYFTVTEAEARPGRLRGPDWATSTNLEQLDWPRTWSLERRATT